MGAFEKECHWMETIGFLHEDGIINLSYCRKWWIPICCNIGKGINLLKWKSGLLNFVKGLNHTMFNLELWPWPWTDLSQTYALHINSSFLTFVQSYLKIPPGVQKIKRRHEIQSMFNLELWPWPWTNLGQTYALHINSSYLTFVQSNLKIPAGVQKI